MNSFPHPSGYSKISSFTSALIIACCFSALALAQSGGSYDLTWSTIDAGGAMNSIGGTFALSGTTGQPDAASNPTLAGGTFELTGGFWPVTQVCYCLGDMNGDGKKDGRDVQQFVSCVVSGGNCSCADVDAMNGVNLTDVGMFVGDLLSGSTCP